MIFLHFLMRLCGIYRCHYCGKYILPWQKFYGKIDMVLINDGEQHPIYAKWVTHDGECIRLDIERESKK